MKRILYIDLDGVLVQYPSIGKPESFLDLEPMPGAIEAFNRLCAKYDVYIASTAPWSNPNAWKDKRLWVAKHLGEKAFKRLILTHNKSLLMGDYLIDDRPNNGASDFKGELIIFGSKAFPDWNSVYIRLLTCKKSMDITSFVRNAHGGQKRANSEPYFNHLKRVADSVSHLGSEYQTVAYLHDYLEDVKGASTESLIKIGVTLEELQAIDNLTKRSYESFSDYMDRVCENDISRTVKAADRADNLLERHPDWSKKTTNKYIKRAEIILENCPDDKISKLLRSRIEAMKKLA